MEQRPLSMQLLGVRFAHIGPSYTGPAVPTSMMKGIIWVNYATFRAGKVLIIVLIIVLIVVNYFYYPVGTGHALLI